MRAIWKGSISFGLVNIPIALYPATHREDLRFHLLRSKDLSPVNYKRVAQADGKEVPWEQIVKGYEYEKGKYVVIKDDDFKRVDVEATQTVDIQCFVDMEEVSPLYFHKPYYMEPQKGGDRAYVLLRQALEGSGKIGIAKVVIKTRQHLAAVKPQDEGLMLELMHFPDELMEVDEFKKPREAKISKKEHDMARSLIDSMTEKWEPEKIKDDYREALEDMIEDKIAHGGKSVRKAPVRKHPPNVVDLVAVLEQSLRPGGGGKRASPSSPRAKKTPTRKRTSRAASSRKKTSRARKAA